MRVRSSEEGGQQQWCRFNASISVREGRRHDEALPEDEAEATNSSWLHGKEEGHGATPWRCQSKETTLGREKG
jgi:hypothetical protein